MAALFASQRGVRPTNTASRAARVARPRPVSAPACRRRNGTVAVRAFFNFLAPKTAAPVADPRRDELAEELVSICEPTDAGSKAAPAVKEQIEELVSELAAYSTKNPVRSPLLWGDYEVLYCSQPSAVGGPLKKGGGPVVFPGQKAVQRLVEPDQLINEVTFKALGFVPGFSRQYGTIKPVSGDTFVLSIGRGEINTGFGTQQREFGIQRRIQVLYLDESLRIARFLPDEDLPDSEGASEDEILFVFRRIEGREEAAADEEEEEEEEDEGPVVPKLSLPLFGGSGKTESLATAAERQVRQQQRAEAAGSRSTRAAGTQSVRTGGSQSTRRPGSGTGFLFVGGRGKDVEEEEEQEEEETPAQRRKREAAEKARAAAEARAAAKEQAAAAKAGADREAAAKRAAAEREAAAKKAAAEREAAAKRAAAEREEAKRRAEQEREEARARAAAIKEQLAELGEELREAQAAAREVAKELADVKREAAPALKQVAAAEAAIAAAAREAAEAAAALQQAAEERRLAEAALKEAQALAREAEAAFKRVQDRLVVKA